MAGISRRATLRPQDWASFTNKSSPMDSIRSALGMAPFRGIIFPYTPTSIQSDFNANYGEHMITHSVYQPSYYQQSANPQISVQATFTCQDKKEFIETAYALNFLKGVTKSHFGEKAQQWAGLPPPVLLFTSGGENNFEKIPVIVKNFTYVVDDQVDYVEFAGLTLPTRLMFSITMTPQYAPTDVRKNFDINTYRSELSGTMKNSGGGGNFL